MEMVSGQFQVSYRIVDNSEITLVLPFWSYFRIDGQPSTSRWDVVISAHKVNGGFQMESVGRHAGQSDRK